MHCYVHRTRTKPTSANIETRGDVTGPCRDQICRAQYIAMSTSISFIHQNRSIAPGEWFWCRRKEEKGLIFPFPTRFSTRSWLVRTNCLFARPSQASRLLQHRNLSTSIHFCIPAVSTQSQSLTRSDAWYRNPWRVSPQQPETRL